MKREDWNHRYATKEFIWTVEANRFLVAEAAGLAPGRALDLAAGECRNSVWLAERGWTVRAVDFADVALEKGKALAGARGVADKITFEAADLTAYTPNEKSFDLVILFYLQIPRAELIPVIGSAGRAVAKGGTIVIVAHDTENLMHGHGGPQDPDVLYDAKLVTAALGQGFTIEKAGIVERPFDTPEGSKVALDCLVRAKRG